MYSVCLRCGEWEPNKTVLPDADNPRGALVICPKCGHEHPFTHLPLFVVAGASGAGKSTVCAAMCNDVAVNSEVIGTTSELVVLDSDILWGVAYTEPAEWPNYMDMWLRVCHNIHQSGRSVLLFGAGLNPGNLAERPATRYFSGIHYLGLVCEEDELAKRLRARPGWRESGREEFVEAQVNYNRWFVAQGSDAESPIEVVSTSGVGVEAVVAGIRAWVDGRLC